MKIQRKISKYNNSPRSGQGIDYIVLHWVGAVSTAYNNACYFAGGDRNASAHYFVDDTSIWQSVEDSKASWHCGGGRQSSQGGSLLGKCTNYNSIGIEMCCRKKNGKLYITDAAIANTAILVKHLMTKYNIPASRVIRHFDVNGKRCPGNYCTDKTWAALKKKLVGDVKVATKYKTSKYAKSIKKYLKALGLYDGTINSYVTPVYTKAVKSVQNKYFKRSCDRDGIGGSDTLKLVKTLYNFRGIKHFKPSEFRCNCGHCTGYPVVISRRLLLNLDYLREKYGAITITSGLRCKWKNSRLSGSSSTSYHMKGKAADMYNYKLTATYAKRKAFIKRWYGFKGAHYAYGNTSNMGNAVHVDVK